ncbi:hypothetical protein [Pseudomonas juntendi]|uniref:hypothetical protein n=1 Tax=Pseudomonas juntendi TaxID=2666183 RepID=UPI00320B3155
MSIIHPPARFKSYTSAAGGWGSARSVMTILLREQALAAAPLALLRQNQPKGFACVSCAWAKSGEPHALEFCENGAKATPWELTRYRAGPVFFARPTLSELCGWDDHDLEQQGRLTHKLRYDATTDHYRQTTWNEAYRDIEPQQPREAGPLQVVAYDIPEGCVAGYYPTCKPSIPLWHHAEFINVPAAKSLPVTLYRAQPSASDMKRAFPADDQVG